MKNLFKTQPQYGDTIVEVMLAILVAGVALATAYQLSNASLRSSTQSAQRSQALSVSSGQIERLKNVYYADQNTPGLFDAYYKTTNNGDFCVGPQGNVLYVSVPNSCSNFEGTIYAVDVHYDGSVRNGGTDTFSITTTWENINGHGQDKQVLYYRFPQ